MAKPSKKPGKKGREKAKAVPVSKVKTAKNAAAKVAKPMPKAVPAKKVAAKTVKSAKSVAAKAKVVAKKSNSVAKKIARSVKPEKSVVSKSAKVRGANPKVIAKSVSKARAKSIVQTGRVRTATEKKVAAKLAVKVRLKSAVPPPATKAKKNAKKSKANVVVAPVIESPSNQKKVIHASSKALARTLAQLPPPPPPPPIMPEPQRHTVSPAALKAFEQAVKVFNRQHYEDAKKMFESLEQKFPLDGEVIGRAQVYLQACAKKLAAVVPTRAVSADDLYDQGVHALNNGDYGQAKHFFEKALKLNPNEPDFLYSLAATHAQTGALDQALDFLKRSIEIKPRFRSQAFEDNDFSGLRENRQFQELLGLTSPFERLEQRR